MGKTRQFQIYTAIWLIAVFFLVALLWQNIGDARIINYSGIVRGATQKLVKEELNGDRDDALITRLDGIIFDLQTGEGDYDLTRDNNEDYQQMLADLNLIWADIKKEIALVRSGEANGLRLFDLSQQHFELADRMVLKAEENSDNKMKQSIVFYFISLALSILVFGILNIRSRKAMEKSIRTDRLTGMLNRNGFETAAADLLCQRTGTEYSILEFDVDHFKEINNTYGYALGDKLLMALASALTQWAGEGQLCARINADDFVFLARHSETLVDDLEKVLNRTLKQMDFLETFDGITFTFGAYRIEADEELIQSIMDKANTAHKTAKAEGQGAVVWYDRELLEKLKLENELKERMHQALADEEFKMYLQPKMGISDLNLFGAEALVRWQVPDQGLVFPDTFIPLFEKCGMIADLDFYMLKMVCRYQRFRMDQGLPDLIVSVNISRVTLYHRAFHEMFLEIVDRFKLPHGCIEVEVTESSFNEVADSVIQILFRLKEDGFLISMDDFGAGYSSLSLLSKLPIQIIKLDREFMNEMHKNENVKGVIACVVDLAHALEIEITCEGVEYPEQIRFLQEIGCDYGQGYYFSKPIPEEDFTKKYLP